MRIKKELLEYMRVKQLSNRIHNERDDIISPPPSHEIHYVDLHELCESLNLDEHSVLEALEHLTMSEVSKGKKPLNTNIRSISHHIVDINLFIDELNRHCIGRLYTLDKKVVQEGELSDRLSKMNIQENLKVIMPGWLSQWGH